MSASERTAGPAAVLEDVPLLKFSTPEVRRLVAASFVPVSYPYGAVIVDEGEQADALYVIASGRARALKRGEGGDEVSLKLLGPGDSFGEAALLTGGARTATVRATSQLEALRLDAAVFRALVAGDPRIREALANPNGRPRKPTTAA